MNVQFLFSPLPFKALLDFTGEFYKTEMHRGEYTQLRDKILSKATAFPVHCSPLFIKLVYSHFLKMEIQSLQT